MFKKIEVDLLKNAVYSEFCSMFEENDLSCATIEIDELALSEIVKTLVDSRLKHGVDFSANVMRFVDVNFYHGKDEEPSFVEFMRFHSATLSNDSNLVIRFENKYSSDDYWECYTYLNDFS